MQYPKEGPLVSSVKDQRGKSSGLSNSHCRCASGTRGKGEITDKGCRADTRARGCGDEQPSGGGGGECEAEPLKCQHERSNSWVWWLSLETGDMAASVREVGTPATRHRMGAITSAELSWTWSAPRGNCTRTTQQGAGHRLPVNDVDLVPRSVVSNSHGDPPLRTRTLWRCAWARVLSP